MQPNHGRVAVITGAARGIGRRTAEVLAARGFAVALNDISSLEATRRSISRIGVPVMEAAGDVSREDEVDRITELVKAHYGRVDVLVNNAGISFIRAAEDTPVNDWRRVLEVNLTGPFLLCQGFGKIMLQQQAGAIVNVCSIAGLAGFSDRAAYTASKHGLIGLTKALASEWGGRGLRCNAVCPGWVKTEMDLNDQVKGGYSDEDIMRRVPLGRFATTEEVAQAVAFLSDPVASGFINGQTLSVDGGWLADGGWDSLRLQHRG
jgi:NAD(P)-dependent dehydrogenase (short-subunit alcohol dehydrogenase family)